MINHPNRSKANRAAKTYTLYEKTKTFCGEQFVDFQVLHGNKIVDRFTNREAAQARLDGLLSRTKTVTPKAVVQEGNEFRVYENEDRLGDTDYLIDTVQAPARCRTDKERREWFGQTLFARSLGGYAFIGEELE